MGKIKIVPLVICFVIVIVVAFLGSLFTGPNTSTEWYQQIKPTITPPNFVFPIAWTILFVLIALSLYLAWINAKKEQKNQIVIFYGINLVLNILWSVIFFGMGNPTLAFAEIILLWASIFFMIFAARKINKISAWFLVPYLLWVTFAFLLNYLAMFA
jgi:translocator protein